MKHFLIAASLLICGPALAQQSIQNLPPVATPALTDIFPTAQVNPQSPVGYSTRGETAAQIISQFPTAPTFGIRRGGSSDDTRTGSISAGTNILTVNAVGDFQAGDGINVEEAGAAYSAGTPASLSATQNGTTGATNCTYYVAVDDGNKGLSAAASVTITNANATQTAANYVRIAYTPPVSQLPGPTWKNCGSGDVYLGAAQPTIIATMTAGSGYTNGTFTWTATGGGCTTEPQGFILVSGGSISTTVGRVDLASPGIGCTSAPTVAVPAGAGAGVGGAITLALKAFIDDAGIVPSWRPEYIPVSHPSSAQADALVVQISSISGNSFVLSVAASTTAASTSIRHSWTSNIQNAINAANPNNNRTGTANVQLPCGVFEIEPPLTFTNLTDVAFSGGTPGPANYCTQLLPSGIAPTILITGGNRVAVQGFWLEGQNKTSGYAVQAINSNQTTYQWIRSDHNPGSLQVLGFNNVYVYDSPQCNRGWAYGYADYDFEGTITTGSLQAIIRTTYCNDMANHATAQGGTTHDGWRFNNVATIYCALQCAISNAEGHGWALLGTAGSSNSTQFVECMQCDTEFAVLDEVYVGQCVSDCWWAGAANGSITGYELNVLPSAMLSWVSGKLNSAAKAGALLGGTNDGISHTQIDSNGSSSSGTYAGVEFAATAIGAIVEGNWIGSSFQAETCLLDSGVINSICAYNSFESDANSTIVDNSGSITNITTPNAGDTSPLLSLDSVHGFVGIGPTATYANNTNSPGLAVRENNTGGDVRIAAINTGTGGNSTASVQESITNITNGYAFQSAQPNSGSPHLLESVGAGMTGGMFNDATPSGSVVGVNPTVQVNHGYLVAALPSCVSALAGTVAYVLDANSPTYGATLTGLGSVKTLGLCNGTAWVAH